MTTPVQSGVYAQTTHAEPYMFHSVSRPWTSISPTAAERVAAAYFVQRGGLSFGFNSSGSDDCYMSAAVV